jgi:hypothetical protein
MPHEALPIEKEDVPLLTHPPVRLLSPVLEGESGAAAKGESRMDGWKVYVSPYFPLWERVSSAWWKVERTY